MGEFMRIMGLDYGAKTVGVAISDEMLLTAQPIETIRRERPAKLRQTLARIESLMKDYDIDKVIIGLPKKLNNEEGDRCEKTREFGEMVERRSGLEVIYQDERLTTVQADNVYDINGTKLLTNADNLNTLDNGIYIVNGIKTIISDK